ncbi:hypothetical protein [Cryobacterium frigoriphilum]|uniref:hypothetical protein n=1 Tax=Cryobacterium frigoriphilum TaxID=1259150 RepID=UPI0015812142|nr:hypothetical protein [Cryobacterium frigoriphilum]
MRTAAAIMGRRSDTHRRRERVLAALSEAQGAGTSVSAADIARRAGVDRSFLYRHRDLIEHLHTVQSQPSDDPTRGPISSRASLTADLAAAHHRARRLADTVQQLEKQLSQGLGHRAWSEAGLGGPADYDELTSRITDLEQVIIDLREALKQRDQDLAAARGANRELMTQINTGRGHGRAAAGAHVRRHLLPRSR